MPFVIFSPILNVVSSEALYLSLILQICLFKLGWLGDLIEINDSNKAKRALERNHEGRRERSGEKYLHTACLSLSFE